MLMELAGKLTADCKQTSENMEQFKLPLLLRLTGNLFIVSQYITDYYY